MAHHRYIWAIAAALLAVTPVVLGARQVLAPAPPEEDSVARALALLEDDPSAWELNTRAAIRAAAVAVEAGRVRHGAGYYLLGLQYVRESNYNGAEALFKRAIAARPDWSWPYVALGNLLGGFAFNRTEEAVAALRKAAQLDPEWSRPHDSLAIILRLAERYEEAEREALKALELAPDSVATNTNYANLLVSLGRLDEAKTFYERAIELEPAHPKPYYNIACVYSLQEQPEKTVEYLSKAIELGGSLRLEARNDPDFDPVRDSPQFRKLVYIEEYRDGMPYMEPDTPAEEPPAGAAG